MVAETAVEDFKLCLQSFDLTEERKQEQQNLLDKIVEIKPDGANAESDKIIGLLGTVTDSLMRLTANVTRESRGEVLRYKEDLASTKVELANANSMLVKNNITRSSSVGKELMGKIVNMGKFKESSFREWRQMFMTILHCMDKEFHDDIVELEATGKEVFSLWMYPEVKGGEEQPHLPEATDKKLQLIMVSCIHEKETKSLSGFEDHLYPGTEAWKYFMVQSYISTYHLDRLTREKFNKTVRSRNVAEFVKFCEEIEAQIIALKQAGFPDPAAKYDELFTTAAIQALPKGGDGEWMASKIRMEGFKWNWKIMRNKMRESLEISEEVGASSLYVQKGNPSRLDYGRFRPRVNRLHDTENTGGPTR